ncbi:ATP-dependent DNA ligase, partial [bacterium]
MTLLTTLVDTSVRVGATASRLTKVRELAATLESLATEEIAIGVSYLSGALPQGRIGLAWRVLKGAVGSPAAAPSLELLDVHARIGAIAALRGTGSSTTRTAALADLLGRATSGEQD